MSLLTRPRIFDIFFSLFFIYRRDLTRLRVYFWAKHRRSSFEIPISLPLVRQRRRRYLPNETARGSYQKESGRDLPIYRADTKAGNIFPRPAGRSSIKYTPPSLDKLKRRMTVLRRCSLVMRADRWPSTDARTGARKAIRGHMTRIKLREHVRFYDTRCSR